MIKSAQIFGICTMKSAKINRNKNLRKLLHFNEKVLEFLRFRCSEVKNVDDAIKMTINAYVAV